MAARILQRSEPQRDRAVSLLRQCGLVRLREFREKGVTAEPYRVLNVREGWFGSHAGFINFPMRR